MVAVAVLVAGMGTDVAVSDEVSRPQGLGSDWTLETRRGRSNRPALMNPAAGTLGDYPRDDALGCHRDVRPTVSLERTSSFQTMG